MDLGKVKALLGQAAKYSPVLDTVVKGANSVQDLQSKIKGKVQDLAYNVNTKFDPNLSRVEYNRQQNQTDKMLGMVAGTMGSDVSWSDALAPKYLQSTTPGSGINTTPNVYTNSQPNPNLKSLYDEGGVIPNQAKWQNPDLTIYENIIKQGNFQNPILDALAKKYPRDARFLVHQTLKLLGH